MLGGVTAAGQSRVNGELAARLHDGLAAGVISFGSGLVLIAAATLASPAGRAGVAATRAALRSGGLRPWQCAGGLCGAYLVVSQGLTVTALGVALFTVALVAGQAASGLAVDRWGLGPAGPAAVTVPRLAGAVLAVVAVIVAAVGRVGSPSTLALAALPALAGIGVAFQQAVNGRVRQAAGSALTATLVNFVVGSAALLLAFAVDLAVRGAPAGSLPGQPVLYSGGVLGVGFIAVAAAVVRFTGVLLLSLAMIAGQLGGAVLLDALVPTPAGGAAGGVLAGTALALVAVAVAASPYRRGMAPAGSPPRAH